MKFPNEIQLYLPKMKKKSFIMEWNDLENAVSQEVRLVPHLSTHFGHDPFW